MISNNVSFNDIGSLEPWESISRAADYLGFWAGFDWVLVG
jgi:hypothetical protein